MLWCAFRAHSRVKGRSPGSGRGAGRFRQARLKLLFYYLSVLGHFWCVRLFFIIVRFGRRCLGRGDGLFRLFGRTSILLSSMVFGLLLFCCTLPLFVLRLGLRCFGLLSSLRLPHFANPPLGRFPLPFSPLRPGFSRLRPGFSRSFTVRSRLLSARTCSP